MELYSTMIKANLMMVKLLMNKKRKALLIKWVKNGSLAWCSHTLVQKNLLVSTGVSLMRPILQLTNAWSRDMES